MIAARNKLERAAHYERLHQYYLSHPCVDCGETDPVVLVVLECDHLQDKLMDVSNMIRRVWAWRRIALEIAKCDVVCANCHRRRTYRRGNSLRSRW